MFLQQKSKEKWLKEGDRPTRLFYASMKKRQYQNHIVSLKVDDGTVEGREQVEEHLLEFFGDKMGKTASIDMEIDPLVVEEGNVLKIEQQIPLIQPITDEEIWKALNSIDSNKSPGIDGYSSHFFKKAWNIVGEDVKRGIRSFFTGDDIPVEFSKAVLTLLPKIEQPSAAGDYRPISCCPVLYKMVTKIMSNRLGEVLPWLISSNQSAFVKGRNIAHNILLAHELLSRYNDKGYIPSCMIKIDIQKAFDSLSWEFMFSWLKALKIPGKFIEWIRKCVESTTYCFSLNGSYTRSFQGRSGVKQGDPISPLLFVIGMEYLSRQLSREIKRRRIEYHQRCKKAGVHSLMFADDLLIFCRASQQSMEGVRDVLKDFKRVTGLQINERKSEIFFSKMNEVEADMLASTLNVVQGSFPVKYLGLPLSTGKWKTSDCEKLVDKIAGRINTWGTRTLPYAGRVQLINTVLLSMAGHWANVFRIPESVHKEIVQKCRDYLWGKETGKRKLMPVAWDTLCMPKYGGGVGLRDPSIWNTASLSKLVWDVCLKKDVLWLKWVQEYYLKGEDFVDYSLIGHWHSWSWGKLVEVKEKILPFMYECVDTKGKFSVRKAYNHLKGATEERNWAVSMIWKSKLQPKHSFFLWMLLKGRLSTIGRLHSKGMQKQVQDVCCLCGQMGETVQHLFVQCQFTTEVKGYFNIGAGGNFREWLKRMRKMASWKDKKKFHCLISIFYNVWLERNRRIFQKKELKPEALKLRIEAGYD